MTDGVSFHANHLDFFIYFVAVEKICDFIYHFEEKSAKLRKRFASVCTDSIPMLKMQSIWCGCVMHAYNHHESVCAVCTRYTYLNAEDICFVFQLDT